MALLPSSYPHSPFLVAVSFSFSISFSFLFRRLSLPPSSHSSLTLSCHIRSRQHLGSLSCPNSHPANSLSLSLARSSDCPLSIPLLCVSVFPLLLRRGVVQVLSLPCGVYAFLLESRECVCLRECVHTAEAAMGEGERREREGEREGEGEREEGGEVEGEWRGGSWMYGGLCFDCGFVCFLSNGECVSLRWRDGKGCFDRRVCLNICLSHFANHSNVDLFHYPALSRPIFESNYEKANFHQTNTFYEMVRFCNKTSYFLLTKTPHSLHK